MKKLVTIMLLCCLAQSITVQAGRKSRLPGKFWSGYNRGQRQSDARDLASRQEALRKQQENKQRKPKKTNNESVAR